MKLIHSLYSLFLSALIVEGADETSFVLNQDVPYNNSVGSQVLLNQQVFGNSWNTPSNTHFSPEFSDFNRVVLELQVNSTGSNFDRLSQLFIDDIEIWRMSTAEPDNYGTTWTVSKDVSHYGELFKSNRTVNFLIKNRITDQYTGVFYVTLTAHFYNDTSNQSTFDDGWIIDLNNLPNDVRALSKSEGTPSESWSFPGDDISVSISPLDKSVNRAVLHVFASGNGDDEFWWDAKHESDSAGPSRFIDAYVDGKLAGFASPYPVIYTGGVNPNLWKPMVDIRTFDVPAYFIDITPFLPTLWSKGNTSIALNVTNGIDSESVPSNWILSYNLLTWSTPGQSNSGSTDTPDYKEDSPSGESNSTVLVTRNLTTSATLNIGGKQQKVKWDQSVAFNNTITTQSSGDTHVWQATRGSSSVSGLYDFTDDFDYPFQCEMSPNWYRVQQSYNVVANGASYSQWIDSSLSLDDQKSLNGSSSRQYIGSPKASHFAETNDLHVNVLW